ncbi:hypothetical protein O181_109658 [Austropuccinia psidii MF-1]|uniref:Uncharacterized protein n=1 Tax=Austropuccinia psidii MF-1 TaxID=1389203 RepID=A0A9Q3PQ17_9BASI|nr:hypothetical protein [Austropuccinia psidii MF-1]
MGPGHIGENWAMGQFMVPWYPWAPSKIGPRGPPIASRDRRPQRMIHGPWTMDCRTPERQNCQKWPYINFFTIFTPRPKKAQMAMKSILSKGHPSKGQGPK